MEIKNFKIIEKGPVVCSFDLFFEKSGMIMREFKLIRTKDMEWVSPPNRTYQDEMGRKKYFNFLVFNTPERKAEFDAKIREMINPLLQSNRTSESFAF